MDINSRINWVPGMELTAQVLNTLTKDGEKRNDALVRASFGSRVGILSNTEFKCDGSFVRKSFEFDIVGCLGLLPSGRIIDVDEKSSITVGALDDGKYYLCAGFGEKEIEFECNCVSMARPQYAYAIRSFDDLGKYDELPLMRFTVADKVISLDREFITPCMQLSCDPRFKEIREILIEKLQALVSHPNLAAGEAKLSAIRYLSRMHSVKPEMTVDEFIRLTEEIAHSVDFFIVSPNSDEPETIPSVSFFDVRLWLDWLMEYLSKASEILDETPLEEKEIDLEAIRAQLKQELYDSLKPEMEKAVMEKTEAMRDELQNNISEALKDFINGEFKNTLHDEIKSELSAEIEQKLYTSLYDALYAALFVPEPVVEETFTPLI